MITCAFCHAGQTNWVEVGDFCYLMCSSCLNELRAFTKTHQPPHSERVHLAIFLKLRDQLFMVASYEDFAETALKLYDVIDELTAIKLQAI